MRQVKRARRARGASGFDFEARGSPEGECAPSAATFSDSRMVRLRPYLLCPTAEAPIPRAASRHGTPSSFLAPSRLIFAGPGIGGEREAWGACPPPPLSLPGYCCVPPPPGERRYGRGPPRGGGGEGVLPSLHMNNLLQPQRLCRQSLTLFPYAGKSSHL